MDWESIKRNFRFRSGRAKRYDKRYPSQPPTRTYGQYSNQPSQTTTTSQPPAPRPVPNASKTSTGAAGLNTNPKRLGPPTHDQNPRLAEPRRPQTQGGAMERVNGTATQPKQMKGTNRTEG